MMKWNAVIVAVLITAVAGQVSAQSVADLKEDVKDLEKRLMKVERSAAVDRVDFSGDFRVEAHSIQGSVPAHFDGMELQKSIVDTMFHFNTTGAFPGSLDQVAATINANYADYLNFTQSLTFEQLKQMMGSMPLAQQQQLDDAHAFGNEVRR